MPGWGELEPPGPRGKGRGSHPPVPLSSVCWEDPEQSAENPPWGVSCPSEASSDEAVLLPVETWLGFKIKGMPSLLNLTFVEQPHKVFPAPA